MLDIILTIIAWRRGWKGWALLPMAITFILMLLVGFTEETIGLIIFLVLVELGTLIFMVAKQRNKAQAVSNDGLAFSSVLVKNERFLNQMVQAQPATVMEPVTVMVSINKAKLVLPDNSEICISDPLKPMGRGDFSEAIPPHDLKYISRKHMLINVDYGKYYIEDLNSANSTKVNGIDIKGKGKQELRDGDRIDVANVASLTFRVCGIL